MAGPGSGGPREWRAGTSVSFSVVVEDIHYLGTFKCQKGQMLGLVTLISVESRGYAQL